MSAKYTIDAYNLIEAEGHKGVGGDFNFRQRVAGVVVEVIADDENAAIMKAEGLIFRQKYIVVKVMED